MSDRKSNDQDASKKSRDTSRARLFSALFTQDSDGSVTVKPAVPVLLALALLVVFALVMLGQCTANTAKTVLGEEPVPTVAPAKPSFTSYQQDGCTPVGTTTVEKLNESMRSPRLSVGESSSIPYAGGEFIAVTIRWDDRRVESPSAIFLRAADGSLSAVSADARDLTTIPDGRSEHQVSAVTAEALAAENCVT